VKPLDLVELIFSLKSTIGCASILNQLYFGRCKSSSQKFSVIGFAVRELQVLEVEGVEEGFMEGFPW
jgi:hypothetical protein